MELLLKEIFIVRRLSKNKKDMFFPRCRRRKYLFSPSLLGSEYPGMTGQVVGNFPIFEA